MNVNIEVSINENQSSTDKGKILENLSAEILRIQNYEVINTVRVTGMEIDVLARHKVNNAQILVECKAWDNTLPADVISKLLGNMVLRNADEGWLITTGPLSKDAEGVRSEWEARTDKQRSTLSFYTSERIIQLLLGANIIVDPIIIKERIRTEFSTGPNITLMLTSVDMYWLLPVIEEDSSFVTSIVVFNARDGQRISSKEQLDDIKSCKNSFSNYQWLSTSKTEPKFVEQLQNEFNSIVPVISGDDWTDYRPARPEDFVGRKNLLGDIFNYFESVNKGKSNTRLFAIKAPSGMGKSSVVLKIASMANGRKLSKNYFVYAVDVRTAMSSRYVELAVKACFDKADSCGFTDKVERNVNFSNLAQYMRDPSMLETFSYLKSQSKTIVLIFDQFEELFSKKELFSLFDNVRALSNIVDSMQGQIILGFAWKTDLTIPAEHPAYYMWSNLADRRKEFELTQFKSTEIKSAISLFGKQLGEKINPILSNYLIKQCQGYPWLLKKLCIHVFKLIVEGSSQDSVIGQRLNIVDLFERDISDLTPDQHACLKEIAINSPANYFSIAEAYGNDMVQALINSRIVIRRASKLTLYWDIFRDYVLNKTVPTLLLDYVPQQQYSSVARVLKCLLENNSLHVETLAEQVNMNIATIDNVMIDAVMFGVVKKENGIISSLFSTEDEIISQLQGFFKKHIMFERMLTTEREGFSYLTFSKIYHDSYADSNVNEKTKITYCSKLYNWFVCLGLFVEDGGKAFLAPSSSPKSSSLKVNNKQRRGRYSLSGTNYFWGQTSPEMMEEAYHKIANGCNSFITMKKEGYRNALELLSVAQATLKVGDSISLQKNLFEIYEFIASSDTIYYVKSLLNDNPMIKSSEVGQLLNEKFNRNWTEASKLRYGNALVRWTRYLIKKEKI